MDFKKKNEAQIQKGILKALRKRGGFWYKTHGGPYQRKGLPDIIGCYKGGYYGLEVKQPGKKLTELQKDAIEKILAAGGIAGKVTSIEESLDFLED